MEIEKKKGNDDVKIVVFADGDPGNPSNWSTMKKVAVVAILCTLSFCSVFGSSSYAPGESQVRRVFNVNAEVASLGLTLYVLGFAFGPLLWGPMSEMYGRKLPYRLSWTLLVGVIAPSAWVNNLGVIMFFRFMTGVAAACALNNGGGVISDMYHTTPRQLSRAIGWYAFCPLSGPIFGSIVGFFVAAHLTHGLWVIRVHWFFVIAVWPLAFALPETHGPTILSNRAKQLRKEGISNAYAAHELTHRSRNDLLRSHIGRPVAMLLREPINIGAAIWISLAYSIIYFFFEVFPVVFVEQNHISFQLGGLPFFGITFGMVLCNLTMDRATRFMTRFNIPFVDPPGGTSAASPEAPLKVVLFGCLCMPISLFWFGWTSKGDVLWVSPVFAGVPFGYSMLSIFYVFTGYTSRTYKIYATSAQAANTLARSLIASIFPIVAHPIIDNLGTAWGVSIFGFLSLGLIPIPIIFIRYGLQLRTRSHFASEADSIIAGMQKLAETSNTASLDDFQGPVDEETVIEERIVDKAKDREIKNSVDPSDESEFGSRANVGEKGTIS